MNPVNLVEQIENLTESWDVEFKAAQGANGRGALPNDFWSTYSAFANSQGGHVILGVEEADDGFRVIGIVDVDKVEQDLWNNLNNSQKISANLLSRSHVSRLTERDKTVLVVKIPRADRSQRPVFLNNNPMTGTFRRQNQGDHRCSAADVSRMLADASISNTRDAQVLENFSIEDLDSESMRTYRNLLSSHNPNHPFLQSDDRQLLRQIKAFGINRETGREGMTVAGLLMLGGYDAIRDNFPQFFLDYRELPPERDRTKDDRWLDRVTPDGTWSGNLLNFYLRVLPKLTSSLRVPYQTNATLFRTGDTRVHNALKEGLVNCLVHADHGGTSSTRVFRSVDRFEFYNPGVLLVDPDSLRSGGRSESRNPILQDMFRLIGIGERAGSGVPAILSAWRDQHWQLPSLEDDIARGETYLVLPMVSLFPVEIVDQLTSQFGQEFQSLSETERLALCLAASDGGVTNRQVQKLSEQHGRDITNMLRELVVRQFLVPHGERQGRFYSIATARSETQERGSIASGSEQLAARSEQTTVNSEHSRIQVVTLVEQVRTKRRASSEIVKAAILELCAPGPITLSAMAIALNRKQDTLRVHYVSKLLAEGRLALRHPDAPNHPNQAYVTKEII